MGDCVKYLSNIQPQNDTGRRETVAANVTRQRHLSPVSMFDKTADVPVKSQSDTIIQSTNLVASRLHEITISRLIG